jgi:hypothetical protein
MFHFPPNLLFETLFTLVNIYSYTQGQCRNTCKPLCTISACMTWYPGTHCQNWRPKVTALHCVMLVFVDDDDHDDNNDNNDNGTLNWVNCHFTSLFIVLIQIVQVFTIISWCHLYIKMHSSLSTASNPAMSWYILHPSSAQLQAVTNTDHYG